jgi:hypothetical protein
LGDGLGGFTGSTTVNPNGNRPQSVGIGDFNGDGHQDLAVATHTGNNVAIRLGNGDGTFGGTTNVSIGGLPFSIVIGDFNEDGKQDFAVSLYASTANSVAIRMGDGFGGFTGTTNIAVVAQPRDVKIGDFNGDDHQDLAVVNGAGGNVSILLGDGAGAFSSAPVVPVGVGPYSIAIGDFNGDGNQDFAVANINSQTVSIRQGDGMGGFTVGGPDLTGFNSPINVAIGDFNEDGGQDLAVVNYASNTVSIRLGAVLNSPPTANAGPAQSIHAGDVVELDGSASFDDNTASALLDYTWSITSQPAGSSAVLQNSTSVMPSFVADLTGDYVFELVVTDEGGLTSDPALVTISSNNQAPTAVATMNGALAFVSDVVALDGTGSSDPDGDVITYSWTLTAAPPGSAAQLVDANTASPTLIPDLEGEYAFSLEVSDFLGPNAVLATVGFTATTAASFAESVILDACEIVAGLDADQVTTKGNQNAFCNQLANAVKDLQKGKTADAIDKLNKAIERTDGCPLRGTPDGNGKGRDWITDCDAQQVVYDLLTLAIDTLE